jgi:predicted nuclease of predicted toxin-antitoxin system
VKLLFDENLSPELVKALADCYSNAQHVREVGLQSASDQEIWRYASQQDFAIVTKDADFRQRSFLYGYPPKVIWIGLGNCSTRMIAVLLRGRRSEIAEFLAHTTKAFLMLEGS